LIAVVIAIVALTLIGIPITKALLRDARGSLLLGTSFLLALGGATLVLFSISAAGFAWSVGAPATSRPVRRLPAGVIYAVIALMLLVHAAFAIHGGMYEWDFFGIWGLKARTFFDHHGIDWTFLKTNISHPDYPLLTPLMLDLPSLVRGTWDDRAAGLLYTALSASLILIVHGLLKEETTTPLERALATLAVASPALNLWIGLAEAPVMAYGCAGVLFVRRGLRDDRNDFLRVGAILLGFAAWSKNEGLALCVVVLVLAWRRALQLWPAVVLPAIWLTSRAALHLQTDFLHGDVLGRVWFHLREPLLVLRAFARFPPDRPLFWLAVIATLIVFARRAWTQERFLLSVCAVQLALLAGQALATPWDIRAHIELSWNRLPWQIAPALAYLAVIVLMQTAPLSPDADAHRFDDDELAANVPSKI
jgi:hypothetical protein